MDKKHIKSAAGAFALVAVVGAYAGYDRFFGQKEEPKESLSYTQFISSAKEGRFASVTVANDLAIGAARDNPKKYVTEIPKYENIVDRLTGTEVDISSKNSNPWDFYKIAGFAFPLLLLASFQRSIRQQFGMKGRKKEKQTSDVTFDDVAGIDEAKAELQEIVDYLQNPQKYTRLGGAMPKGVLLTGPSGTGKTLLAKAVAGEAGVPFFSATGSEFDEMFVGVGASRVRSLFEQAKKNQPCILFIDEIDAVGRKRGDGSSPTANRNENQTINQLLTEMDGFEPNKGIIFIGATNMPESLDPALLRPGRFDRQVVVPLPDIGGRTQILKVHTKNKILHPGVNLEEVARRTSGKSGADLANICNMAATIASIAGKESVEFPDFEEAVERVLMGGRERRSMGLTAKFKELIGRHELGHAFVGMDVGLGLSDKISIVPRGQALGVTIQYEAQNNDPLQTRQELKALLAKLYGGRTAEELFYGPEGITPGAVDDLQQIAYIARKMVEEAGLADDPELAMQNYLSPNFSEATRQKIDDSIKALLDEAHERAKTILVQRKEQGDFDQALPILLEKEVITGEELQAALNQGPSI